MFVCKRRKKKDFVKKQIFLQFTVKDLTFASLVFLLDSTEYFGMSIKSLSEFNFLSSRKTSKYVATFGSTVKELDEEQTMRTCPHKWKFPLQ